MTNRIASHKFPEHYIEKGYLVRLLAMAGMRLNGDIPDDLKDTHTLTTEYIYRWKHQYRYKIASCGGSFPRFNRPPVHTAAVKYFDDLTQDLLVWVEGGEAISFSRLGEAARHLANISQCYIDHSRY